MKKFTDFIIDKRYYFLTLFILLSVLCAILSTKVKINYDMANYLPSTSETRIGMDIMEEEFKGLETSSLNVMIDDLNEEEKLSTKKYLEQIDGVSEVAYDDSEKYNKENHTLYVITVDAKSDSKLASDVYDEITNHMEDKTIYLSGDVADTNKPVLPIEIVVLAVFCALIILIIMCESYVEPFLFLTAILMAVLLNNGTNIIFPNVSYITKSISAILQLALSMDYSIMLMNRYNQEKEQEHDKVKAMKNALNHAFQSISSSSVTTIAGLLALVFMSFTIGRDLGFVLAKGVLFSLVCIFFVLPTFILMFDHLIVKTKKKTPIIKMDTFGKISHKMRYLAIPLFLLVLIGSFILKGNLKYDYTNSEEDEISKVFKENNQMAIIYSNKQEEKIGKYLEPLENYEKVDEVLGYSNTIHQRLTYDKLNQKLNDLGSDVTLEDYLLKILYYHYYNKKEDNKVTWNEFVTFIETEAYNNKETNDKIDEETKENIAKLENFTSAKRMNEKKTAKEIANILGIQENDVKDLFTYYLSKYGTTKMSVKQFVTFMNQEVLTNPKYIDQVDATMTSNLKTLSKFTNANTINQKQSSKEMAQLFGLDENTTKNLYQYYASINDVTLKLTLNEFANFVLTDVVTNAAYKDMFSKEALSSIKLLATFSNPDIINKDMDAKKLAEQFGIDEQTVTQLLLLKYGTMENNTTLSIEEMIEKSLAIDSSFLNGMDLSLLKQLQPFAMNQNDFNTKKISKDELKNLFNAQLVDKVITQEIEMSPKEFVDQVLELSQIKPDEIEESTINQFQILKLVIDSSLSSPKEKYTATEIANYLGMKKEQMYQLYALIDLMQNNTSHWKATPYEFVNLILQNSSNALIQKNLSEPTLTQLKLISVIMTSTIQNKTYTYKELNQILPIETEQAKNIYLLYTITNETTQLTPKEFVDFLLAHQNDSLLQNKFTNEILEKLKLIQKVMNSVLSNTKYSSKNLSSLLNTKKDDISLIYGLYDTKYINTNYKISLKEFVSFLLNDVVTNPTYSKKFDQSKIIKLKTINEVMIAVEHSVKYTSDELYEIICKLSENVDKDMIDVLYIYYGSMKEYDTSWTMTTEEFVNYLNEEILPDKRFIDFIDEEKKQNIIDGKETIKDAKKKLLGPNYSRVVLNTTFAKEEEETFNFIQDLNDTLGKDMKDFYIIGDSPMAYDMSQSFDNELNTITIITMVVIFLVVAVTFKSAIIPIILVLTIQCAVYLTMGILSFTGDNVYFIAILIVQSILMGATIDYAILYTSYYIEHRKLMNVKESIIASYNKSIHTILTSASILIIVTLIVGNFASAIASKICTTISQGTLCSSLLILILLPAVLAACDKVIIKNK